MVIVGHRSADHLPGPVAPEIGLAVDVHSLLDPIRGLQFGKDVDRYSLMAADGWLVLRFAGRHLGGPTTVIERTRSALMTRGWRP